MIKKNLYHLFITYDGLLDPLGKSQIIPYLKSITNSKRKIKIISFEKNRNVEFKKINLMRQDLIKSNIIWKYKNFSENYGKIGKTQYFTKSLLPTDVMDLYQQGPLGSTQYQIQFFQDGKFVTVTDAGNFDS